MDESGDADDWVEVRRFTDPIGANMIRDFLADHGVRVAIRGNPEATRMTWSQTSDILRIVVARADLDIAKEALEAMTAGDQHPFRGLAPAAEQSEGEEPFVKPRRGPFAIVLAVMVPIGAGHFYARHGAAGTLLCSAIVGSWLGMWLGHDELAVSAAALVMMDAVGSFWAVKRFNEKRVPPESVQRQWAMGAIALAFAAAFVLPRAR